MVPPSLNQEDPCYPGIKRIGAILRDAESAGRIHRRDLRLDIFFSQSGGIQGYRVNLQTKAGWQTVTFFKEEPSNASEEGYFQQHLAERVEEILSRRDADDA